MQAGHPFAGIFNPRFQLQRVGIDDPDLCRIGHRAHVERVIEQQDLPRAVRESLFVTLAEQQAFFDFAAGGINGANAAVQRVGHVQRTAIRTKLYGKVFQVCVGHTEGFQGRRVQLIDRPALHIFKAFSAGHV